MVEIIRGENRKEASTSTLIEEVKTLDIDGYLYIGYPIIGNSENINSIDALLISPSVGIIIFDIVIPTETEDRSFIRDELFNNVYAKFVTNPKLVKRRQELLIDIGVITYAPAWREHSDKPEEEIIVNESLENKLREHFWEDDLSHEVYKRFLEALQSISRLRSKGKREVEKPNSKGAILNELEDSISNLDIRQSKAVIETVNGIQRIRGLAGSGKTIVLALKVAYLHTKFEDWTIGVTFYTRALKDIFREYITKFTIENKQEKPDWNKIKIMHAWGNQSEPGIYSTFCSINELQYLDYYSAKRESEDNDYIGYISQKAIDEVKDPKKAFDIILIDEAQDMSKPFLKLCYNMIREHDPDNKANRRLIYAYDELQNLNNTSALPSPKDIFGKDIDFDPASDGPNQDVILDVCYRNFPEVLVTAHALGFGIYRDELVTMFKDFDLWKDVGYEEIKGELGFGQPVVLQRRKDSSPYLLDEKIPIDELIKFKIFKNHNSQIRWIADQIEKNIVEDELDHKDIIVIHPEPRRTKSETGALRKLLFDKNINNHLAGVSTSKDEFYLEDSVAFTSIYRAKGNEGAMVYLMNAEHCATTTAQIKKKGKTFDYLQAKLIKERNTLFTAITRSKAWVRVCGIGPDMSLLKNEYLKVKENEFKLSFTYPLEEELDKLNTIQKGYTSEKQKEVEKTNYQLLDLLKKLQEGEISKDDIDPDILENIQDLLKNV